ncbi:MAG: hypothetical protein ACRCS7_06980 [Tannerellaceae bacterium]
MRFTRQSVIVFLFGKREQWAKKEAYSATLYMDNAPNKPNSLFFDKYNKHTRQIKSATVQ